jgi:hypothetical protein
LKKTATQFESDEYDSATAKTAEEAKPERLKELFLTGCS